MEEEMMFRLLNMFLLVEMIRMENDEMMVCNR